MFSANISKDCFKDVFLTRFPFQCTEKANISQGLFLKYNSPEYGLEKTAAIHSNFRYCHTRAAFGKAQKNCVYRK